MVERKILPDRHRGQSWRSMLLKADGWERVKDTMIVNGPKTGAQRLSHRSLEDGKFLVFVDTPQSNDQRSLERAVSNQNVRHRFIANFVVTDQPKSVAILASDSRPKAPSTANATSLGSTGVKQEAERDLPELRR